MSPTILDETVLSRPYFDRLGLILALAAERPVAFAHAGFGPDASGEQLDTSVGAISQLVVDPAFAETDVLVGLVDAAERYLTSRGATRIVGGSYGQLAPFYLGIYGGSGMPGVLASDSAQSNAFELAGYRPERKCSVWECQLATFRPPVDRQLLQLRRSCKVAFRATRGPYNWWDACHLAQLESLQFEIAPESGGARQFAQFWDMEPIASTRGRQAMGLAKWHCGEGPNRALMATHLLSESIRELAAQGIGWVEVQIASSDSLLEEVCKRLGFSEVDQGFCWFPESMD